LTVSPLFFNHLHVGLDDDSDDEVEPCFTI